jgi:pimeloyl-ACP methyl ester carboxylesterase
MKPSIPFTSGYSKNDLPFVKVGDKPKILLDIEALSFNHKPPTGFELKRFIKSMEPLLDRYTVYLIGRKPNLPAGYYFDKMADDYAEMIRNELGGSVDIIGISTGGQICHFLAANHPDLIQKVVITSAAYRLSEQGVAIEREAAEWFQKGKYGKTMNAFMKMIMHPGILRRLMSLFTPIMGRIMFNNLKYPNDFLVEVEADREMNFLDRLGEIKAPTLILSGEDDIMYSIEDVKKTACGIPNCELKLYPRYGHNLSVVNMKQVVQDMIKFLNHV